MSEGKIGYRDILHQKEYMKTIIASLINRFGDSIDAIAMTWIVYELTGDAMWSALIFGVNKIPTVLVTPFAGAWVERRKKKPIMIWTDFIRAACVGYVATGFLLGFLQPWMLLITTLIISLAEAFRGPANMALLPKILDKKYFEYGLSLQSSLANGVEMVGLALAGGIIALIGTAGAIYIDVVSFVLSAVIIFTLRVKEEREERVACDDSENFGKLLADGIRYVSKKRILIFLTGMCVLLNAILVPINSLQAPLAGEIFRAGAGTISAMNVSISAGMMLGTVVYPYLRMRLKIKGKVLIFVGTLGIGLYNICLVGFRTFYDNGIFLYTFLISTSMLLGFLAAMMMSFVSVESVKLVEQSYLARVSAFSTAMCSAATPFASFLISGLAAVVTTKTIFLIVGGICTAASLPLLFVKILDVTDINQVPPTAPDTQSPFCPDTASELCPR